jgi:hypothetical protein
MTKANELSDHPGAPAAHDAFRGAGEQLSYAASSAKQTAIEYGTHYVAEPAKDIVGLLQDYAKSRPEVAAAWCFALGLFIGWKLRP